jgi:predicted ATPase
MLKTIKLTNLLSFGKETEIPLNKGLNVLIGTNGSGKSNLIEAISLLQAMPKDLTKTVRDGGGIQEWLWKGEKNPTAEIEVVVENPKEQKFLGHIFRFRAMDYRLEVVDEFIDDEKRNPILVYPGPYFHYDHEHASIKHRVTGAFHAVKIKSNQSILAQRQDPEAYPEIAYLSDSYQKIRLYREWQFGRYTSSRKPQRADLPIDFLEEDIVNLALVLNSLCQNREAKTKLLDALKLFNESVEDFRVSIYGGHVEIFFQEKNFNDPIPATRLSDGTLRFLSLLAILLHPNPPPLICIEEPELGLHPDVLPTLIELLKEAAQKTQVIITTHSADLVDDLTDIPEAVLVFDKHEGSTTVNRLNKDDLSDWLKEYRLGQLWRRGDLGGNRW